MLVCNPVGLTSTDMANYPIHVIRQIFSRTHQYYGIVFGLQEELKDIPWHFLYHNPIPDSDSLGC